MEPARVGPTATAVTVMCSATSRATVFPSALSSRMTLTVLVALTMGSSALRLISTMIRSRTGPGGRSRVGRRGDQPVTGCSAAGVPSARLSSSRPPRRACSNWSISPARYSRQSKVSSQVRRRAPGTPASGVTVNTCDSVSSTAGRRSCPGSSQTDASRTKSSRPGVIPSRSPLRQSYARPLNVYLYYPVGPVSEQLANGPCQAGNRKDIRGPRHPGLGAGPGGGRGARGGGRADRFAGRDARGQGDGQRADEGVAGPDGVDRLDPERLDGQRGAVRGGT